MNTNDLQQIKAVLDLLKEHANSPFWERFDSWVGILGLVAGLVGIYYAVRAFVEASLAKDAAKEAGKIVKYQTTTFELVEILKLLAQPAMNIEYASARDILAETSHKLHRIIATFENESEVAQKINAVKDALTLADTALVGVRPTLQSQEREAPNAVYFAIEAHFAKISNLIGELQGLFEKKTVNLGGENAR